MSFEQEQKKKVFIILFAFLVLVTFININNQNTPSGAFYRDQFSLEGEKLFVPCDTVGARDLVDLLVEHYGCERTYCREIFFEQSLPGNVNVQLDCLTPSAKDFFLNACKSGYRNMC